MNTQRLGQHFLTNKNILERIASAINPQIGDTIIEIGPGHGELTDAILNYKRQIVPEPVEGLPFSKLILIEKDESLAEALKEKYKDNKNIEVIPGDALKVIPSICHSREGGNPVSLNLANKLLNYKVVGNIPYYLTGFLIRILLELEHPPQEIVFTIQKEVAERIVAKPPHMNLLAVSVQYFGTPEFLFTIPKSDFDPPPKIDSATIKITPVCHSREGGNLENQHFFTLIKAGFSHPRKLLINNLSEGLAIEKPILEQAFKKEGITPFARAQELSLPQWHALLSTMVVRLP
ncbi:MAG: ribosomal RNA small subunit methyltransferase A [Parcubacteria group bacterium]|nr:ribosomal RNA small subunit methyltransferase A [Parcubacteria group bacterium]